MNKLKRLIILALSGCLLPALTQAENLMEVYQLAVDADPQIKAAEAAYQSVQEGKQQARARLLPQLSLNAALARNRQELESSSIPGFTPGTSESTNKSYSLDLRQAAYNRDYLVQLRQADAVTARAEADFNSARQELILRVAQRYFDILAARDNLEFARAENTAIAQQLKQTRQRFEVGLIAITDVHEAQAAADSALAQEIDAENNLAVSKEALREATGRLLESLQGLAEGMPLSAPDPASEEEWIKTALEQNLTLLSAQFSVDSARQDVERGRAGHHPTLDVVASYGYADNSGALGSETTDSSIGLQFRLPLYQGGGTSANIRAARFRLNQATETLEQQRRTTERSTRSAYLNVQASISRVKALNQAVVSNESALEATQAGYEVGTRTIVDVLAAQRELYKAKRDYSRARYDYILNHLRLKEAAGILSVADLEMISRWLKTG